MKNWSRYWKSSKKPRKQRKFRYNAPAHARRKLLSAHLSKFLRKEYGKRSIPLRKGDEVKIARGEHKKKTGKISGIDATKLRVFVEGIKAKKVSGQEVDASIDPSNVIITKLNLDDKKRLKALRRGKINKKEE